MGIHLYQVIVVAVSIFMIYQGIMSYVKGKGGQTLYKVFIRVVVWGGMSLIAIFPDFTNILAKLVGLQGNINAVILSGIERLEQGLSEVTRKEALKEIEK
jgi:hypothetical protein